MSAVSVEHVDRVIGRGAIWPIRGEAVGRPSLYILRCGEKEERFRPTRDLAAPGREGYFLSLAITTPTSLQRVGVEAVDRAGGRRLLRSFLLTARARLEPEVEAARFHERVVIALGTHNPSPALLKRQIESLRSQSLTRWQCLVRDDGSTPERFAMIEEMCAADPRFIVVRDAHNRGFYANFERCLASIPEQVEFVALCDQDDRWHPHKLARSLEAFDASDVQLVYSDMRLTDPHGRLLSDTFWVGRRHTADDLDAFLLNNPVTSAASVVRRSLLDWALPFPEDLGGCFHDHWLACVARARGRLRYLDTPLYDYTQHRGNVIGHEGFHAQSVRAEISWALAEARGMLRDRAMRERRFRELLLHHYSVYRKLELFRLTLLVRCGRLPREMRSAMACYQGHLLDAARLILVHGPRARLRGSTLNLEDIKLAAGLVLQRANGALRFLSS